MITIAAAHGDIKVHIEGVEIPVTSYCVTGNYNANTSDKMILNIELLMNPFYNRAIRDAVRKPFSSEADERNIQLNL